MFKHISGILLLLIFSSSICDAARILAVFSSLSYADHLIFRGYVENLVRNHHSVILMTPYPGLFSYPDIEKIIEIDVSEASAPYQAEYKNLVSSTSDYLSVLPQLNDLSVRVAVAQIRSQRMSSLLVNPNIQFDLVVTEADMPLLYAFAEKYKAPHVSITASHGKLNMYDSKGNPNHPLLYPDVYSQNYGNLTIWQKIVEIERHLRFKREYYSRYLPKCQEAAEKIFSLNRDLLEVEYDIDLLLVSGTAMLIGNRPTVPAIIYVDRLHIKPGLPLPEDLKPLLDASERGFVYFSLGAAQQSENLPEATVNSLMESLGRLPFVVLWKMENATAYKVPKNVLTRKWFPQQEVLAHPNIKAFITHGGPRSLEEALYYEVPLVVVPVVTGAEVFAEQLTKFGAGVVLDPYYTDQDAVRAAVSEVASNATYKQSISKLKKLAFDQPMSGAERATWWTEYALRHGGARHLRAPAVGMPLYKYLMLDLLAVLLALACSVAGITFVLARRLVACYRRGRRTRDTAAGGDSGKWKML